MADCFGRYNYAVIHFKQGHFSVKRTNRISILLTSIIPIFGLIQVSGKFLGPKAAFDITTPKWAFAYLFFILLAALALFLSNHHSFQDQKNSFFSGLNSYISTLPTTLRVLAVALFAAMVFALILFTPLSLFFALFANGFFTQFSLLLTLVALGERLTGQTNVARIVPRHWIIAFSLYILVFIGGVLGGNYPFQVWSCWLLATVLLTATCTHHWWRVTADVQDQTFDQLFVLLLLVFALAFFVFLQTVITGAWSLPSIMDEGSYGIKGLLFTSGQYSPYQDYGPWTNKMPLSFLLPGIIQQIFGAGILTLRMASLAMLVAIAILLFQIGQRIWPTYGGLAASAFFMLNPALDNFYNLGNSQIYTATLLTLSLYFALRKNGSITSLVISNMLASIVVLTRENMAIYLAGLNLYILWKLGWRRAIPVILAGIMVFGVGHAAYWPGILKVWAKWLPKAITPFLDAYRYTGGGTVSWKLIGASVDAISVANSFLQGIASNFFALAGLIMLPIVANWKGFQKYHFYKEIVFLAGTLVVLNLAHGVITLNDGSCIYCFSGYLSFYLPMGIVLTVMMLPLVDPIFGKTKALLFTIIGAIFTLSNWFIHRQSLESLFYFKIPSLAGKAGVQPLFVWARENFGVGIEDAKIAFPLAFGTAIFLSILLIFLVANGNYSGKPQKGVSVQILILICMLGLPPFTSVWMHSRHNSQSCRGNVILAHSRVDAELKQVIPAGSKVYWLGESTTPFLTMDVKIFPQQINDGFSYKVGSNSQIAEKYGFWNEEISARWAQEADFLMIEERYLGNPILKSFVLAKFTKIASTSKLDPCDKSSRYLIFRP